jgi:effector-binding domain-containing protein
MKILKAIGIGLLALILLGAVISFFLPSMIHVERSIDIAKSQETVYKQVSNLKMWKNWSYWDNLDPKMESVYEGPEEGVGAKHSWKSTHEKVGNGSMTITAADPHSSLLTELAFGSMISKGGWTFDETETGTRASMFIDLEMPFYTRIFPGLMMESYLGKDFEASLAGLKKYCETLPDAPSASWEVEEINFPEAQIMTMTVTCKAQEIGAKLGESYGIIGAAAGKQGVKMAGPVFAIYQKFSMDTVVMQPGFYTDRPAKTDGEVNAGVMPATKVVKVDYYGDYPGTEQAHYFIDEWVTKNNKTITGPPWEEYVTDPMAEPDTSKWLTRIYYPIQ